MSTNSKLVDMAMSGKHNGVKVQGEDLLKLTTWVDMNCPFLGDEEIRQIPDPEFPNIDCLPIRPLTKSAPDVKREYSQEEFNSGYDRLKAQGK